MQVLDGASRARKALRERNGAAPIINYDCSITVSGIDEPEPRVAVRAVAPHESPFRVAVMEMMLLAGEAAATWAHARSLPLLYRCAYGSLRRHPCTDTCAGSVRGATASQCWHGLVWVQCVLATGRWHGRFPLGQAGGSAALRRRGRALDGRAVASSTGSATATHNE